MDVLNGGTWLGPKNMKKIPKKQVVLGSMDPWFHVVEPKNPVMETLKNPRFKNIINMLYFFVPSLKQTAKSPMEEAEILPKKR